MRIAGRSESPSFPSLEGLLPMEKSWALEVEREEETSCLQPKIDCPDRGTASVKQIQNSWVSCKRLNSGSREASHRSCVRENECYKRRASRFSESKHYRDDPDHDSFRRSKEIRTFQFTSSARCYPPSIHTRSSEFSVSAEERALQFRDQRDPHERRRSVKPNRSSNAFVGRQHFTRSKNGSYKESQGGKLLANTLHCRQGHFGCLNHTAEMTSSFEAFEKHRDVADNLSHFQDHQELDDSKHKFQSSLDKHSCHRHGQYFGKSEFSEHSHRCRYVKKMEHQGPVCGVSDWKNAKQCGRAVDVEMKGQNEALLAVQSSEGIPEIANIKEVASEVVAIGEIASQKGMGVFESSCTEESEIKADNSIDEKTQYEMLACLLFDDLQDIDEDCNVIDSNEGPDCEYSGSIFDDELDASIDIDSLTTEKEAISGKVPMACISKHPVKKASAEKSSAGQHAKISHNAQTCSGLKKSSPVLVDVTNKFEIHTSTGVKREDQEDDAHRLSQRKRQIEFGKNTLGYERYSEVVPRLKRKAKDPQTPNPKQVCSKRSWDGQIRKWRRLLHDYDPPSEDGEEIAEDFSILKLRRSTHEEKGLGNTSLALRQEIICRSAESDETEGCTAGVDTKNVEDASFTIYDDWMES